MAIKKEIIFTPEGLSTQLTLSEAYIVIDRVDVHKSHSDIHLSIYESKSSRDLGLKKVLDYPVEKFSPELDVNKDIYKLAYDYLKTTQMFSGATDC
ncbi:hypothetical protein CGH87_23355 [Vibrio parahaemolyticus]|uniref:hypothetical protein n=1 Tax=Vibrio parahaemolyticus TaxID=670 RepID=UPI000543D847|nr:hypothetical protein [Vibrio parahaemolyticus]EGR3300026.1 hypothetical protein [Vibrio parahaemolyticus]EGR3316965.1 hypothetical protein [Vibrio parahaemolyticus]KHF03861.1 hypothetical protein PO77_21545 [Vibrio parahaemolyticus]TOL90948.1 hypothetical protein CGH87_23355 [Vibrio parahaemolyticus]